MCTVSIITRDAPTGYRVVCNRDESRERAPATPPRWHTLAGSSLRAVWPTDTAAGGTWIAAGEHGLTLCLLNLNPEPPLDPARLAGMTSRGLLIPRLIGAPGAFEAVQRLGAMDLADFPPFRLVAVDPGQDGPSVVEARWDLAGLGIAWHAAPPLCFVSSGLGDSRVAPRLDLFEGMIAASEAPSCPQRQDAFHRHAWAGRSEISVMMSRAEARTVSVTSLDVRLAAGSNGHRRFAVSMAYDPVGEPAVAVR